MFNMFLCFVPFHSAFSLLCVRILWCFWCEAAIRESCSAFNQFVQLVVSHIPHIHLFMSNTQVRCGSPGRISSVGAAARRTGRVRCCRDLPSQVCFCLMVPQEEHLDLSTSLSVNYLLAVPLSLFCFTAMYFSSFFLFLYLTP